ncbi:MAG TPA: TolC family protein, partial [Balneolales bacterium]|nr:TolC family protein [Balneolales bacterium]
TKVTNIPRLTAFADGMYGRPGLNIFKNQFEPNYMLGVRLTWNIWDWHEARRQRSMLSVQKKIVNTQESAFLRGVHIGMQQDLANISKYRTLMSQDNRIIELRKQVESQSASQLRNGTITPSNYLEDLNQVYQARLSHEQHRLQWIYAIVQYKTQTGTL